MLRSDAQNADKYYRLKYDAAVRSPARKEDVEAQKASKAASRDENDPVEVISQKRRKAEPSVVALCGDGALYDAHQWKESYAVRGVWDDFEYVLDCSGLRVSGCHIGAECVATFIPQALGD
ncbi:hypothetical protein FIBSPDRAFT_945547 [Athelia psychrophila]|uniref:Uncharacterized protein n=1 Tax=Athelia psychrophila TaxID=1759441 RepID=A0A166TWM4_9AGAM|nr:hypothetical protein FIBSPDRAFT_945547 [Fibularhizoctonia sp. CBS 109695]